MTRPDRARGMGEGETVRIRTRRSGRWPQRTGDQVYVFSAINVFVLWEDDSAGLAVSILLTRAP